MLFIFFLLDVCSFTKRIYLCLNSGLYYKIVLAVFYFSFHWNWMLYNVLCIICLMCIILPNLLTYVPIISITSAMILHFSWFSNKTRNNHSFQIKKVILDIFFSIKHTDRKPMYFLFMLQILN